MIVLLCTFKYFIYQLRKGKFRAFLVPLIEHYLANCYLTFYCCYRKYRARDFGNNFLYLVLKYWNNPLTSEIDLNVNFVLRIFSRINAVACINIQQLKTNIIFSILIFRETSNNMGLDVNLCDAFIMKNLDRPIYTKSLGETILSNHKQ